MKLGFLVTLCVVLAACATTPGTSGVHISDTDLKTLKPGVTTLEQVEAKFGEPQQSVKNSDGTTEIEYLYTQQQSSESRAFLKRLNPFAMPDIPNAQITQYRLTFRHDKLVDYKVAQSGGSPPNATTH